MTKKEFFKYARIVLTLCLITALIGALLALVNAVTKDRIEENRQKALRESINAIFAGCDAPISMTDKVDTESSSVSEVYAVKVDGALAGYCVLVTPKGYGGKMEIMIGLTADGAVKRISVVDHSETAGLGTKVVEDENYLANYNGKSDVGSCDEVNAVSGATRSSKGLATGVKDALALGIGKTLVYDGEVAE